MKTAAASRSDGPPDERVSRSHSFWTLAAAAALAASGCVSSGSQPTQQLLVFSPDSLDSTLINTGYYHQVNLIFELNPESDLPPGGAVARVYPRVDGAREIYRIGKIHEVVYEHGAFEVGGYRYRRTAGPSRLYVFKKRSAPLSFRYRDQPITLEGRGHWVPSVLLSVETGGDPRAGDRWRRETLRTGSMTLVTDSREDSWFINDRPYKPSPENPLTLKIGVTRLGT